MTTELERKVLTPSEHGVWVRLKSFPACNVFVRMTEVQAAMEANRHHLHSADWTAHNIALGIRCGSFPLEENERRRRIRALP